MKFLKYSLVALPLFGCGDDRLRQVEAKVATIDTTTRRLELETNFTTKKTKYVLSDIGRNAKTVGMIWSSRPIAQGDRIFLGDDIWDVKMIKIFASQADTVNGSNIDYVGLLVIYIGKATDPKPGG